MNIKNTINSVINAEKKIVHDVVEAKIKTSHYIVEHIKGIIRTATIASIAIFISFAFAYVYNMETAVKKLASQNSELSSVAAEAKRIQEKEKEDQRLGEYIMFIMSMRKINTGDFQKQLLAQDIVRVTRGVFDTYEERSWFVILVNNESGFNKEAKSPAGAVGLSQVMPQFIEEFSSHCNIKGLVPADASDPTINLLLGACRFKHLLVNYKGVYSTALAAYNAGKEARSVKELQRLANLTTEETLQYLARFTHVKATADANEKNNPKQALFVSPEASIKVVSTDNKR
jgi:hypothetical protein